MFYNANKKRNNLFYERNLKMKKIISLILVVLTIISPAICTIAVNERIDVYLEEFSGIDGQKINFDIPPQSINNRTMVPIRAIFEAMGATVEWDEASQTAISKKDDITVKMTLNSTIEYINDSAVVMDVAPVIIEGRILAPARYVAEAFGYKVKWDDMTKSVLISKNDNYDISKVVDGTRQHPYRLGDTVSFDFWYYDEAKGNCTLTLESFLSPDEMKAKFGSNNVYTVNNLHCIVGHIKLNEYSLPDACSDIIYSAEAVTSKLKPMGNYAWRHSASGLSTYGIELYSGGETDCYIQVHNELLVEGETVDYFTITYRSGDGYDDKRTIWYSLK